MRNKKIIMVPQGGTARISAEQCDETFLMMLSMGSCVAVVVRSEAGDVSLTHYSFCNSPKLIDREMKAMGENATIKIIGNTEARNFCISHIGELCEYIKKNYCQNVVKCHALVTDPEYDLPPYLHMYDGDGGAIGLLVDDTMEELIDKETEEMITEAHNANKGYDLIVKGNVIPCKTMFPCHKIDATIFDSIVSLKTILCFRKLQNLMCAKGIDMDVAESNNLLQKYLLHSNNAMPFLIYDGMRPENRNEYGTLNAKLHVERSVVLLCNALISFLKAAVPNLEQKIGKVDNREQTTAICANYIKVYANDDEIPDWTPQMPEIVNMFLYGIFINNDNKHAFYNVACMDHMRMIAVQAINVLKIDNIDDLCHVIPDSRELELCLQQDDVSSEAFMSLFNVKTVPNIEPNTLVTGTETENLATFDVEMQI